MQILSLMGQVMDLNQWLVLAMFVVFIIMLFRGIPVVYSLVGVGLVFVILAAFVLDPNKALINEYIHFRQTGIS